MPRASVSGIPGVMWQKNESLWKVQRHDGNKGRYLGSFPKELLGMAVDLVVESKVTPPSAWNDLADKYRRMKADVTANDLTYKPRSPEAAAAVEATGEDQPEPEDFEEYAEDMGGPADEVGESTPDIPSTTKLERLLNAAMHADKVVVKNKIARAEAGQAVEDSQKHAEKLWAEYFRALSAVSGTAYDVMKAGGIW